jgi:hypothetical protein
LLNFHSPRDFSISSRTLYPEKEYNITVVLQDYEMTVFMNGKCLGKVTLNEILPKRGNLVFECRQEMFVDDLTVEKISAFEFVKPN